MDQVLTYRDGCYYDFTNVHQFQFPHGRMYNHDPIYGKTGTNLKNSMDDDEFRVYLFMIMSRGAALNNLYYSYDMADEGQKWLVTKQALAWKKDNYTTLTNSQYIGGDPKQSQVYGFSSWSATKGIIALRNPSTAEQQYDLVLDNRIGVPEDMRNFRRTSVLNFRAVGADDNQQTFSYNDVIVKKL